MNTKSFTNLLVALTIVSIVLAACGSQPTPQFVTTLVVATAAYPAPTVSAPLPKVTPTRVQIEDGSIDQTDVPTTVAWLHQQYGQFFSATIVRQVLGDDPSLTFEVGGEQFLVNVDVLVNDPQGGVFWPLNPGNAEKVEPGSGLMIVTKNLSGSPYACFIYGAKVPQVTTWVDPASLEGKYVRGNTQLACFDTIVTLDDGRGAYLYDGYVYGAGGTSEGSFEGWAHWEYRAINLTTQLRDPAKDALVVKYAEEMRALPGDWYGKPKADELIEGPISACYILENGWSHIPGLFAPTVEWLCGRLSFDNRYVVTSQGEKGTGYISDWIIGTARVAMTSNVKTLTTGDTYRVDFRTFIEVVRTYDGQCKGEEIEVWINQIAQGAVVSKQFCVSPDEYLFVLPEAFYDFKTDNYWIPEGVLNFKFK